MAIIKSATIIEDTIRAVNPNAGLYGGVANIVLNDKPRTERKIHFTIRFNHEYDPISRNFAPRKNPVTGADWDYVRFPFSSVVTNVTTSAYNGELSDRIGRYFNDKFRLSF
ncbi:hypothetical protein HYX00_05870 [Candidatus Woesearchaeota archaeon]|nr:hypothetical protein [Candidatus Woesearchaeota archaeon]